MSILALILFLSVVIPDSPAITNDNQSNYSNGIIINQPNLFQDAQTNYDNGILIVKDSVLQDEETTSTPAQTSSSTSSPGGGGGGGVASSENFSNILQFEQHEGTLIKDKPTSFKFNLSIYEILLTGKENEYSVNTKIEVLRNYPIRANAISQGEAKTYFNVVISSKRIKTMLIRFISIQPAELFVWNQTEWEEVNVVDDTVILDKLSKHDNSYTYAISEPQSIMSFAVVNLTLEQPKITDISLPTSLPTAIPIQSPIPKESPAWDGLLAIIAIAIATIILTRR